MIDLKDIPSDKIVFYDIETDHQFAAYAQLRMIGVQYGWSARNLSLVETDYDKDKFRDKLADPDVYKVSFNGFNFDNLVLYRYGYAVNEKNAHDTFLMIKTIAPGLPSYSLKFINWLYFHDHHFPEMELEAWAKKNKQDKWKAPASLLAPYCLHDIYQTVKSFCLAWPVVQREKHWRAYSQVEQPMGLPMEEIMLRGGEYLDAQMIGKELKRCKIRREQCDVKAQIITNGEVVNCNSVKQIGDYLDTEGFEIALTDNGNWSIPKKELLDLRKKHPVADLLYEARKLNNQMSYYENYLEALQHCDDHRERGWIPKQYSCSSARTRRILSNSLYKINFQNANLETKAVQLVPPGWLGWWIDATQIENVVHIHESDDAERRAAYEADPDWSEYVWLCNKILGNTLSKKELDDITKYPSPQNPTWSVYKQYKTIKLALNFGMGEDKYAAETGLSKLAAKAGFDTVHAACPAIRKLSADLQARFRKDGFVQDVFGHVYVANPSRAYKIVAYLIQGCGTGSLPKACIRGLYDVVHECDVTLDVAATLGYNHYVRDIPRNRACLGVLSGTTHDEIAGRISLDLSRDDIVTTLHRLYYVMTEQFSPLFDNIPLRAKLYLSRTNALDGHNQEVDLNDPTTYERFLKP